VHYDEVEIVVERKDCVDSAGHISSGRRIQAPQIGNDNVQFESVTLGDAGDVAAQWFVGGAVGQEKGAGGHASVNEI
jgi:hypothetical protein